jgi:HNH endonuclease
MTISEERIQQFKEWLHNQGATVLDPTNPYELVRFRNANGVGVVYTGKRGLTFTGEAAEGWQKFKKGQPWKLITRKRHHLTERKKELARRDGERCFAHGNNMHINELTIEHLLSFSQGGSDNNNNLVLVCEPANKLLGNKPLSEKIELIIQMRRNTEDKQLAKSMVKKHHWWMFWKILRRVYAK